MRWCNPWGWKRSSKASILWRFWWREMGFLYQSQLVCEKMEEVLSSLPCLEWQKGPHLLHVCAIAMFHSGFFRHFASEQQPNWLSPDKYLVHRGMLGDFCSCVSGDAWSFALSWPAGLPDLLGQGVRRPVRWGQETWGHSGHYSLPVSFWGTGCVVLWVPGIYSRPCFQSLSRGSVCCWTIVTSKFCSWTCLDICIIHNNCFTVIHRFSQGAILALVSMYDTWSNPPCHTQPWFMGMLPTRTPFARVWASKVVFAKIVDGFRADDFHCLKARRKDCGAACDSRTSGRLLRHHPSFANPRTVFGSCFLAEPASDWSC